MYISPDGQAVDPNLAATLGGVQYPPGWFLDLAQVAAHGLEPLYETAPPTIAPATQKRTLTGYARDGQNRWVTVWLVEALTVTEASILAAELASLKKGLMSSIDDTVAARIAGSTRFALGYEEREAAATAFKSLGYPAGEASTWITRFARNTGMTDAQATDLILAQAAGLRAALKDLEDLRMDKYLVQAAGSADAARAVYDSIRTQVAAVIIP
jgi:hypothetical protein